MWAVVGYADEGAVDFYASEGGKKFNYTLQNSVQMQNPISFGAYVDMGE